jgi:hypothetical protein
MSSEPPFVGRSLCVVGNINRDVKTAPLRAGEHLFRDGETSVSFIAETIGGGGPTARARPHRWEDAWRFLAKWVPMRWARASNARFVSMAFPRIWPETRYIQGTSIGLAFDNGQRHFISCLPASRALALADLDLRALSSCDHLLRADVWFSDAMMMAGNKVLCQEARKAGLATSLDLNWDPCWGHAPSEVIRRRKQSVRAILPWIDLALAMSVSCRNSLTRRIWKPR